MKIMMTPRLPEISNTKEQRCKEHKRSISDLGIKNAKKEIVIKLQSKNDYVATKTKHDSGFVTLPAPDSITVTTKNKPSYRLKDDNTTAIGDKVLGKLRKMTTAIEKTSFSLFGAENTNTSTKTSGSNRIAVRNNLIVKPLHHSSSESQISPQKRRYSRIDELSKPLKRYNSDLRLPAGSSKNSARNPSRNSSRKIDNVSANVSKKYGNVGGMRRYNSTFTLNTLWTNSNKEDLMKEDNAFYIDSDNKRVEEWLKEVENADAPPEQYIDYENDTPSQTDTAVHIVYEGD